VTYTLESVPLYVGIEIEREIKMENDKKSKNRIQVRSFLFRTAEEALEREGWTVERIPRFGKSSVRRITKGKDVKTVSIRTSRNTWIAFPRTADDRGWATLADVDYVVAASVERSDNPEFAQVHLVDGDEMRARFDRAYAARKKAGYTMRGGLGMWLSLYDEESQNPVTLVGAGAGRDHLPIAKVPLTDGESAPTLEEPVSQPSLQVATREAPLTIAEAKRRLAMSLGVSEADIKITING